MGLTLASSNAFTRFNLSRGADVDGSSAESIDARVELVDAIPTAFNSDMLRQKSALHTQRNVLSLFNRLPNETQASIFEQVTLQEHHFNCMHHIRLFLSRVSLRWRNVINSTPHMWTGIDLGEWGSVVTGIERSGTLLLDVEYDEERKRVELWTRIDDMHQVSCGVGLELSCWLMRAVSSGYV